MFTSMRRVRESFFSIFVAAFLVGAAFRVGPQVVSASHVAASSASTPTYEVINNGDESPQPRDALARAAVSFYRAVINGSFNRAYDLSVENHWADPPQRAPRVVGTQPRSHFVAALNDEIGSEGLPVGIVRLAVDWERPLHQTRAATAAYPELQVLHFLPPGTRVGSPYEAHVSGRLVGNCQIAGFARTDLAVQINGQWKLLLPGRQRPGDPHFEEWFLPHTHFHATFRQAAG